MAIKSLTRRIYPNFVNCDFTNHITDENNPDTFMATMGCRTMIGYDRHGLGYSKVGRGNIVPTTVILPKLGLDYGIALGKRNRADLDGFWAGLEDTLELAKNSLLDRYEYICSQSIKSAPFIYKNGTMKYAKNCIDNVREMMKHNTLAIGYVGLAEMLEGLFGCNHANNEMAHSFGLKVIKYIYDYTKRISDEYDLNFGCYATPAESLVHTMAIRLRKQYGIIKNITDREYITNSHHTPVWEKVSIIKKLEIESPFCYYAVSGCITYIELDSSTIKNEKAIENIIDIAFKKYDIPYLAFNFPLDSCLDCGYQDEIKDTCPQCGSHNIEKLRRITGYLTKDYRNFNKGKRAETDERVKHSIYTNLEELI